MTRAETKHLRRKQAARLANTPQPQSANALLVGLGTLLAGIGACLAVVFASRQAEIAESQVRVAQEELQEQRERTASEKEAEKSLFGKRFVVWEDQRDESIIHIRNGNSYNPLVQITRNISFINADGSQIIGRDVSYLFVPPCQEGEASLPFLDPDDAARLLGLNTVPKSPGYALDLTAFRVQGPEGIIWSLDYPSMRQVPSKEWLDVNIDSKREGFLGVNALSLQHVKPIASCQ